MFLECYNPSLLHFLLLIFIGIIILKTYDLFFPFVRVLARPT